MSDIMIPGITNSGMDTDGMVEDIMEAERAPVTRMEERIDAYEEERLAWQEIQRRVSNLQDASRLLFGFDNPFNERIATSSDESVLTASAERNAPEGRTRVSVKQLAEADRFISRNLSDDFQVAAGRYGFRVGESEEFFNFAGGTLEAFAQTVNQRAGDLVNARVVRNTAKSRVILIEAHATGEANQLSFLEASREFALEASILEEVRDRVVEPPIQASTVGGTSAAATRSIQAGTLTVAPGGDATVRMPGALDASESLVMELEVSVRNFWEGWAPPDPPPGPEIPDTGSITLDDITILNAPSRVPLPEWREPEPPVVRDDLRLLSLQTGTSTILLPELDDTDGFETVRIPLSTYVDRLTALQISNNNTHREVSVRNITVFDPRTRGDVTPVNPIGVARDAIVQLEGIDIVRPTNSIGDLIEGVTLNLERASDRPVEIGVEPDREAVTDSLIQFLFYYNELIREINILTRNERAVVDELTNFSDEEREEALERLGLLQGNLTLNGLKSRLQTILMNPYPTDVGSELTLLAQLGISTNETGPGGGFDASRLRGYMEMNPSKVDESLRSRFLAVRQLFGSDTDGDRATDTGVAYLIEQNLRPYVQTGGVLATRTGSITRSISDTERRVEQEEERLERVEARYRAEFAQMEAAMRQMQDQQQALDNLQTQTSGN